MNFEELQQSWQGQPLTIPDLNAGARQQLAHKWQKAQRQVLWSNIGVTGAFAVTLCVLAWVYLQWHSTRGMLFTGSLAATALLLLTFLSVLWKGTVLKRMDPTLPGTQYLKRYHTALRWRQRTLTTYTWVYMVLLWLAMILYMADVLQEMPLWVRLAAPATMTVYVLLVKWLTRKKQKRQLQQTNELIAEVEQMMAECAGEDIDNK